MDSVSNEALGKKTPAEASLKPSAAKRADALDRENEAMRIVRECHGAGLGVTRGSHAWTTYTAQCPIADSHWTSYRSMSIDAGVQGFSCRCGADKAAHMAAIKQAKQRRLEPKTLVWELPPPKKPKHKSDIWNPEHETVRRLEYLRADREARRRLAEDDRPAIEYPPIRSLDAVLDEPDAPTPYRIDAVMPDGGRTLLSAPAKAGKTTLSGNVIRSLVDGDMFLRRFAVHNQAQRLVLIDNELSPDTQRRWLRDQKIENTKAVAGVVALRGKVSTFNLLDDRCRAEWARRLSDIGCDYLILDCLRPVLDALGLDENKDTGRFLVHFDELLADAGIADALVVHHMGHVGERARGDSRLLDWPDALWRIVRENEEPDSARYFAAHGRDVDVAEGLLTYDHAARRLGYTSQSRRDVKKAADATAKAEKAAGQIAADLDVIIAALVKHATGDDSSAGLTQTELREAAQQVGAGRERALAAISSGIDRGIIDVSRGRNNKTIHRLAQACDQ